MRIALCLALTLAAAPLGATSLDDALRARCTPDPRLDDVAAAAQADPRGFDRAELRDRSEANGLPAPTVQTLVLEGGDDDSVSESVSHWLGLYAVSPALSRCAVTRAQGVLALVMVPRSTTVEPVAREGGRAWRLAMPEGATAMELVATSPEGATRRAPVGADGVASLALDAPGRWTLEAMATFETGPQPVALWTESVGATAARGDEAEAVWSERELLRAVNQLRRAQSLPALRRDPLLDGVAREHAARLAASGRVAHTPTEGDSPVDRLRRAGVRVRRVAENLARARNLTEAHARLARSPGHRANLLDAQVDAIGFGVARAGSSVYVVELLAARPALGAY